MLSIELPFGMLVDRSTIYLFNVKEYAFFCSLCIHDFFESNLNTFETLTFFSDIYFYHQALKNKKVNTYTFTYKSIYYYIHYFKMLLTYSTILRSTQLNVQNNLIEFLTSKKLQKRKKRKPQEIEKIAGVHVYSKESRATIESRQRRRPAKYV